MIYVCEKKETASQQILEDRR